MSEESIRICPSGFISVFRWLNTKGVCASDWKTPDDEFYGLNSTPILSNEALIRAQETLRRNKELSLLITIGLYALNIIDANVDAHLLQYNMDTNLAVKPYLDFDTPDNSVQLGLSLNIKF